VGWPVPHDEEEIWSSFDHAMLKQRARLSNVNGWVGVLRRLSAPYLRSWVAPLCLTASVKV